MKKGGAACLRLFHPSSFCLHPLLLPRFLVRRVLALLAAELLQRQPVGAARLLLRAVVAGPAEGALEPDVFSHDCPLSVVSRPLPGGGEPLSAVRRSPTTDHG